MLTDTTHPRMNSRALKRTRPKHSDCEISICHKPKPSVALKNRMWLSKEGCSSKHNSPAVRFWASGKESLCEMERSELRRRKQLFVLCASALTLPDIVGNSIDVYGHVITHCHQHGE